MELMSVEKLRQGPNGEKLLGRRYKTGPNGLEPAGELVFFDSVTRSTYAKKERKG